MESSQLESFLQHSYVSLESKLEQLQHLREVIGTLNNNAGSDSRVAEKILQLQQEINKLELAVRNYHTVLVENRNLKLNDSAPLSESFDEISGDVEWLAYRIDEYRKQGRADEEALRLATEQVDREEKDIKNLTSLEIAYFLNQNGRVYGERVDGDAGGKRWTYDLREGIFKPGKDQIKFKKISSSAMGIELTKGDKTFRLSELDNSNLKILYRELYKNNQRDSELGAS